MIMGNGYTLFEINNWQVGCLTYELLTGVKPFDAKDKDTRLTIRKIMREEVQFDASHCKYLSKEARNLLVRLLDKTPNNRMQLEEA